MYITHTINMNRLHLPVKGIELDKHSILIADCRMGTIKYTLFHEKQKGIEAAPLTITGEGPVGRGWGVRKKGPSEKVDFPDGSFKIPV